MVDKFETRADVTRRELDKLREQGWVTKAKNQVADPRWSKKATAADAVTAEVTIGVTFRTDGGGSAHQDHDVKGLLAINDLVPAPPCRVRVVALPRGASGPVTPHRAAAFDDLEGIDLLYIPGAPAAPTSQVSTTGGSVEERDFNRKTAPTGARPAGKNSGEKYDRQLREFNEFASRAPYELRLIEIARTRGIPILAICAGSWRLLESYGGKVRTLPITQRAKHKATQPGAAATWGLTHGVNLSTQPGGIVKSTGPAGGRMAEVNSTHWAVACMRYNAKRKEFALEAINPNVADPDTLIEIAAMADDPLAATVEAFESRYGAPTIGIQWHPETYLPGMPGETQGSPEGRMQAKQLFMFLVSTAMAAKSRKAGIAMILREENAAFAAMREAAKAAADGNSLKCQNAMERAERLLAAPKWSLRMRAVAEAVDTLLESARLASTKPVGAFELYRDASSKLRQVGIMI